MYVCRRTYKQSMLQSTQLSEHRQQDEEEDGGGDDSTKQE